MRTLFYYSPQRRWLTRIRTGNPSYGEYLDNTYTRNGLGQITAITSNITGNTAENWTYGYDGVDRLINATNANDPSLSETYTYDNNNNLTSKSRSPSSFCPALWLRAVGAEIAYRDF